jgi:hypothetical protein
MNPTRGSGGRSGFSNSDFTPGADWLRGYFLFLKGIFDDFTGAGGEKWRKWVEKERIFGKIGVAYKTLGG